MFWSIGILTIGLLVYRDFGQSEFLSIGIFAIGLLVYRDFGQSGFLFIGILTIGLLVYRDFGQSGFLSIGILVSLFILSGFWQSGFWQSGLCRRPSRRSGNFTVLACRCFNYRWISLIELLCDQIKRLVIFSIS